MKPRCTRSCLSCTLRLYMCNVIVAGMSKRATQTRFLGNYKIYNTPFLRSAHLPEVHRICQVVSKNRKLVGGNWANSSSVRDKCPCQFSQGRQCRISMYEEYWGETCPHWHVCGSLCVSGTMLRQIQGPGRAPREHAECFLSIVGHTNAEQRYY